MKKIFCGTNVNNNEDYKKVIKARMNLMAILFFIGIATIVITLFAKYKWNLNIEDYLLGVYTGAGTGLTCVSVVIWIKNKMILGNDEKLKESRLKNTDERIIEISSKAVRVAAILLLITIYLVGFIGSFFYPILIKVLLIEVAVFLVGYSVSYKIYESKM